MQSIVLLVHLIPIPEHVVLIQSIILFMIRWCLGIGITFELLPKAFLGSLIECYFQHRRVQKGTLLIPGNNDRLVFNIT